MNNRKIDINLKASLIEIDIKSDVVLINGISAVQIKNAPILIIDNPKNYCSNSINSKFTSPRRLVIDGNDDGVIIETYDETWIYYRIIDDRLFLSASIQRLMVLGEVSNNIDYEKVAKMNGYYLPFETLIHEIKCTGANTKTLIQSDGLTKTILSKDYLTSFNYDNQTLPTKKINENYIEDSSSYLAEFHNIERYVVYQSGMDSCLINAIAQKAINPNCSKIQMHCDLSGQHFLGAYQNKITKKITDFFPSWTIHNVQNEKNLSVYTDSEIRFLVPNEMVASFSTDSALDKSLSQFPSVPTLVLQGDKTSLYQHFNGTLEYRIAFGSNLIGSLRRFLFGKYTIRILYSIARKRFGIAESLARVSYSLLAPSYGVYTAKLPSSKLLLKSYEEDALFKFITSLAKQYELGVNEICPVNFHSLVRDQILYFSVLRNRDACMPDWARVSFCGPFKLNPYLGHRSMSFYEIFSPKLNIRNRLLLSGFDIDKLVKSIDVDHKLKIKFWMGALREHISFFPSLIELIKIIRLKLNHVLNYDYGSPASLIGIRFAKIKKRVSSRKLGSINYLINGYEFIGNMSSSDEFKKIEDEYNEQIKNITPTSPYSEEISIRLCMRDNLPLSTRKLQLTSANIEIVGGQPSMVSRNNILDYYPQSIANRVNKCIGFEVIPKSLIAWTQVKVPYKPWLHRDNENPMRYKLFLLLEDVDQGKGPTRVYNRFQSFIIGLFYCTPEKLDFTKTSDFAPKFFKPFNMIGVKGDLFLVQTHENYHSEGSLDEGQSRSIAQFYLEPK